ncbi:MAG TPA: hypothetical protein VFE24_03650 [Pirellulales bacterium]|jgi:hypothetical protein|nr:hypothetical protein [Pirellulales bacterium]
MLEPGFSHSQENEPCQTEAANVAGAAIKLAANGTRGIVPSAFRAASASMPRELDDASLLNNVLVTLVAFSTSPRAEQNFARRAK